MRNRRPATTNTEAAAGNLRSAAIRETGAVKPGTSESSARVPRNVKALGVVSVLTAGFCGYALVYAGFALAQSSLGVWLLFALYGVPYAMTEGLARAYVCDLVPPEVRATAVGGYTFVLGLAALPASAGAGLLWDEVGHAAPFALSAVLMSAAAALLALVPARRRCARV